MIAPGIILPFDGNHANIPAGFSRKTALDGRFVKGHGSQNPGATGGASQHQHTSPVHSHVLADHTHPYALDARTPEMAKSTGNTGLYQHAHTGNTGSISGGSTSSTAATYGAVSNNPPFYEVIFIESTGYNKIPANAMVLNESVTRAGMIFHQASKGRYLRGAGTGQNAGATGGSYTNIHNIDHVHTAQAHGHATTTSSGASGQIRNAPNGNSGGKILTDHTHQVSVNSAVQPINAYSGSLTCSETVEPANRTLNAFKNESVTPIMPSPGDVAMFSGSLASIPVGWVLCDGSNGTKDMRNRFIKTNSSAGASTTGGSNTHAHVAQSHTHTVPTDHTHSAPNVGGHATMGTQDNTPGGVQFDGPTLSGDHVVSVSAVTAQYNSSTTTADSVDNQPEYYVVAFIQLKFVPVASGVLARMVN